MPFPIPITFTEVPNLFNNQPFSFNLHSGLTILVGPNGSGKTQFLKFLRINSHTISSQKTARYISAGRLGFHEYSRANVTGTGTNIGGAIGSSSDKRYRQGSESAIGDFFALSERTDLLIKVSERLRKLFQRDIYLEWDSGSLNVKFKRTDVQDSFYTSSNEASGLLHVVAILTALYNDEIGILFIDEPEVSLHPQLQSFLRMEMEQVAGDPDLPGKKAIIISTHSTEFIHFRRPEDILNIIFFSDVKNLPKQLCFDASELKFTKIKSLLMRMSHSHKMAFFAKRPLLVEGPSDEIICSSLENKCEVYLNAAGSQLLPVIGKDQMPVVSKLFQSLGKNPVILMDLDGMADGLTLINALSYGEIINSKAQSLGHNSVQKMAEVIYNDFSKLVQTNWVKYESLFVDKKVMEEIQKRRTLLKYILNTDVSTLNNLIGGNELTTIRNRFNGLLNLLEEAGCFILRKGTIEDYYFIEQGSKIEDKIFKAALEVSNFDTLTLDQISVRYNDIIRALKYAAQSPEINEAEAVSEILLSLASPAISKLNGANPLLEINNMATRLLLEKATLFTVSVYQSGDENVLVVDKNSTILNVEGFPIQFTATSNPNDVVRAGIRSL